MATVPISTPASDEPSARTSPPLLVLLRDAWLDATHRPALVGAGVAAVFLGVLFWENLVQFVHVWSTNENYSHGFLVRSSASISPTKPHGGGQSRSALGSCSARSL